MGLFPILLGLLAFSRRRESRWYKVAAFVFICVGVLILFFRVGMLETCKRADENTRYDLRCDAWEK